MFEQLGLEKIFGRAMYALIAAFARHVCFAESDVLGLFVVGVMIPMAVAVRYFETRYNREARRAQEDLTGRRTSGKLLLDPAR